MKTNERANQSKKEKKPMTIEQKRKMAKEGIPAMKEALAKYGKKSAA